MIAAIESHAQGWLKTEYMTSSKYGYEEGEKIGSGDLMKISGAYNLPFSLKQNERGQVTMWSASIYGAYGILNNKSGAAGFNPNEILNTSINLTHIRPISAKWSLLITLGGGIYSAPDEIKANSILVNGGVIFMYKLRNNLDLGIGAGLTNSFGIPVAMPMFLVNWNALGKYDLKVNMSSGLEISGAYKFNNKFKLKLVAMEVDGMSAVMNVNGESMIYASATLKSYLCPEYKIGKSSTLYLGVGGNWLRSADLTNRTLKDFFNSMFSDKNDKMLFSAAGYFAVGFRYGF